MKGFKLEYQVSRTTSIDHEEVKGLAMLSLKSNKYEVEAVTNNSVRFDGMSGRSSVFSKLDKGVIEIEPSESGSVVRIKYYINLLPPFAFFMIFLIVGIAMGIAGQGYIIPLFLFVLLSLQELMKISLLKNVSQRLLEDIIK